MKEDIIKKYLNGITSTILAQEYKVSKPTILNWLRKEGVEIRSQSLCQRKYKLQEDFFENLDTPEKAYYLGLLYADGHVKKIKNSYSVRLRLAIPDQELTKNFSKAIYFNEDRTTVHKNNNGNYDMSCLSINSKKIGEDLILLGCTPNKSKTLNFDSKIFKTEQIAFSFILGFLDGDGGMTKDRLHFTSNKEFCIQLKDFLELKGLKVSKFYHRKNNYGSINLYGKENLLKFFNLVYLSFPNSLERKKNKIIKFIS